MPEPTPSAPSVGSLCMGYGGLDLALEDVLGARTVWCSEIDKHACQVIEARYPHVVNHGDLKLIDWAEVEPIDILTAGYPCQPFSHAGKRKGTDDPRHLWPYIADALRVLRPRLAVFENVAGHVSLGFDTVLADLAELGFDAEWVVVRASDVGACHARKRLFVVAADASRSGAWWDAGSAPRAQEPHRRSEAHEADAHGPRGAAAADAGGERHGRGQDGRGVGLVDRRDEGEARQRERARPVAGDRGRTAPTDADDLGCEGAIALAWRHDGGSDQGHAFGDYGPAVERHARALGRPAPAPVDDAGRLSARFVEWMMMLPDGWVTDLLPRNPALKALGNGVVPAQAAYAIRHLLTREDIAA